MRGIDQNSSQHNNSQVIAANTSTSQIGEMHSLYQDLFLTDIKKEVETAKAELKTSKQE